MHIDNYSFGSFVVNGKTYESDIKIVNNEIIFWKDHSFSLDDVKDVVNAKPKPTVIIIGTGASGVVQITQDIIDYIKIKGINVIIQKTAEACETYNKLSKKENVAAILHSTC